MKITKRNEEVPTTEASCSPGEVYELRHGGGYYIVCLVGAERRLFNLETGRIWASESLFGRDFAAKDFRKVDAEVIID